MNLKSYIRPGNGASDLTPLFSDARAFADLIDRLSGEFMDLPFHKIVGIEGRGLILGSAIAYKLGKGFVPVRSPGKLKHHTLSVQYIDYSRREKTLEIHSDALIPGEQVVVIDDWLETGESVKAAITLVEHINGRVVGVGVFMDDSADVTKSYLSRYNYHYLEQVLPHDQF